MRFPALPHVLLVSLLCTPWLHGIEITAEGSAVVVAAGKAKIGGRSVTVSQRTTLSVAAAPIRIVSHEPVKLSMDKPVGWAKGTRLKACNARDVNAAGSFVRGSLEIRRSKDGELLKEGEDYLVDAEWGHVGLGPKSRVTAEDTVFASYRYSLLRMDTVQVAADGKVSLKEGEPHISTPIPPPADAGSVAMAHVFIGYGATEVTPDSIYPITETA